MTPKSILLAGFCLVALQLNAQNTATPTLEGFRGLEWGTSIDTPIQFGKEEMPATFSSVKTSNEHTYYTRENEDYTIGTAELELIYYVFDEYGHFCKAILEGQPDSYETMLFILEHKYGETPTQTKNTELSYKEWLLPNDCYVRFYENADHDYSVHLKGPCQNQAFVEKNTNVTDF
ncbi:MAG: hypothetical protein KDC44_01470 [Phaeodactylibacter sp.]|nr:hypothetical protein [Phaeodactylibacter sp.]